MTHANAQLKALAVALAALAGIAALPQRGASGAACPCGAQAERAAPAPAPSPAPAEVEVEAILRDLRLHD